MLDEGDCTGEAPAGPSALLHRHSNANLLKIDTHDSYSTASALRKFITKELQGSVAAPPRQEEGAALLPGLTRMNKNPRNTHLFLAFDTPEDRASASEVLQTLSFRGKPWCEVAVTERDLNLTHKGGKKRPRDGDGDEAGGCSKVAQYESYPMAQQLELKKRHCLGIMKSLLPAKVYGWEAHAKRFVGIVESPVLEGYRNHVNLSFGLSEEGNATLGFMKGSLVEGTAAVESAVDPDRSVVTMNTAAKIVAAALMRVYGEFAGPAAGGLSVFDKVKGTGFWRRLQVRHNVLREVLLDVECDEDSVSAEVAALVKARLVEVYSSAALTEELRAGTGLPGARVVSVQYHKHSGTKSLPYEAPRVVLYGEPTLTEHLWGLQYELSPTAFFQVNTPGMEKMLEKVHEVAALTSITTLLDLCSGTGTIGLSLARFVKRVVGIELVETAVLNARRNAERNGITNAVFHCGRVESTLMDVINGLPAEDRQDIVAVLDPPRAGVTPTVLKWIRSTPTIRRVVYISCEQKALERDCPGLTKPSTKAYRGLPFAVTSAFAVDLFPHTHHVEMVAVLERVEGEVEEEAEDGDETGPGGGVAVEAPQEAATTGAAEGGGSQDAEEES